MGFIGTQQLVLILLIVLVLFGAKRVPELAKGLGAGIREFKKAVKDETPRDASDASSDTVKQASETASSSESNSSGDKERG